ncbi:MAG: LytTR family DNA-binding domain-containing protein [Gemmatimonadota bacterium]
MIRALIVDDEPQARSAVRRRLQAEEDVEVVGEADDGGRAVEAIRALEPDLVFLDVQMPHFDGFEVIKRVAEPPAAKIPLIIFVTAFDRYAIRAFETSALDYLLKPFTGSRFAQTLEKARISLQHHAAATTREKLLQLLRELDVDTPRTPVLRFTVRKGRQYSLIAAAEVDWFEASGNYVRLHSGHEKYLLRRTMKELMNDLDSENFARIHRSTIVNLNRVASIRPEADGRYTVQLDTGAELGLSATYRGRLLG